MNYRLFDENELKETQSKFIAVYFCMGNYNEDDDIPKKWIGLDCPFEDSLVLRARTTNSLLDKMEGVWEGEEGADFEECKPEVICDGQGNICTDLMKMMYGLKFNPDRVKYSRGRENLTRFWEREKWRFIS